MRSGIKITKYNLAEFDWGTNTSESFKTYIIRIENQIDICLEREKDLARLLPKIVEIFRDTIYTTHGWAVISILREALKREPTVQDAENLVNYVRQRLERKISKVDTIEAKLKQLN